MNCVDVMCIFIVYNLTTMWWLSNYSLYSSQSNSLQQYFLNRSYTSTGGSCFMSAYKWCITTKCAYK